MTIDRNSPSKPARKMASHSDNSEMEISKPDDTSPPPPSPRENILGDSRTPPTSHTPPPQILKKRHWGSDDEAEIAEENLTTMITDNLTYEKSGNDFVTANRVTDPGFSGAFPGPPAQIYHGINKVPATDPNKEIEMREYNIKLNMDLKRFPGRAVNPGEKFKHTISILKKADPELLLLPLPNSNTDTIITRIVHIPSSGKDLDDYLEYKMATNQIECFFKMRTRYTVYQLKNKQGVMQDLQHLGVFLRHTSLETVKSKVIATLYRSHPFYTRREDALAELKLRIKQATGNEGPPFVLNPGLQTHQPPLTYKGQSPIIRQETLLVETEIKYADIVLQNLFAALLPEQISKWPITGKLQVIPIRPFGAMDENLIGTYAMKQNRFAAQLENFTLRGYKNIDKNITKYDGGTITLRNLLLYSKDSQNRFLFQMVERANTDRIFLVYKKGKHPTQTRIEVRKFAAHLNQELHKIFPPESLQIIRTVSSNMSYYSTSTQENTKFSDMVKNMQTS